MASEGIKETLGEALMEREVGPEAMENLVKVLLVGGDVEAQSQRKKRNDEPEPIPVTKQLDDFQQIVGEFVPPAFNPGVWAQTLKVNTRLARCIRSFARNAVGLGWSIEPIHPVTEETPKPIREMITKQIEILREFFNHPNPTLPLTEIFYLEKVDEEATGNGYIEIVRNNSGRIMKMFHAPSVTIRKRIIRVDGKPVVNGFVQIRGSQKRYFKDFGDKKVMDAFTGKYHEGNEVLSPDRRATEMIHFLVYDPGSSYYGAPRYVPAATAIAGNRQAAIRNVNFFENDAVPRMALLVSGGRINAESMQQIEDFVRAKGRGVENAHRVMIVQVEPLKVGFQSQNKVMVELKPLTVGVTEDASFSQYREANDEEVREIFGLGQIFFKAEGANRANAQVSREITNEQELEPDRLSKEYLINQTIVEDILFQQMGVTGDETDEELEELHKNIHVRFRFARLSLTDPLDEARMNQMYASLGALTPNELRESLSKPPFPKDYFFADKPLAIAMAELSAGLALAIAQREEEKVPQPEAPAAPGMPPGMGAPEGGEAPPEGEPEEEAPEGEEEEEAEEEAPPAEMAGKEPKGIAGMTPIPGARGSMPVPGLQVMPKPGGVKKPPRKPRPPKPTQGIASLHGTAVSSRKAMSLDPRAFGILTELMGDVRKFALAGMGPAKGDRDGQDR